MIDQHYNMRQYDLLLEKDWATQSGYFRPATKMVLGMGITNAELMLYHDISEQKRGNTITMREYNGGTVYG